jgi:hypothetical protein
MGNPTRKFNDFHSLRQRFDGSDPIMDALKTGGDSRSGHAQRVANPPEWAVNDVTLRAVLLRAFPNMKTNPTQRARARRWAFIIQHYFRLGYTAQRVALEVRYEDAKKSGQDWDAANAEQSGKAVEQEIENLVKRVTDTVGRISRVAKGLRTDNKPRIGKMGRPRKV